MKKFFSPSNDHDSKHIVHYLFLSQLKWYLKRGRENENHRMTWLVSRVHVEQSDVGYCHVGNITVQLLTRLCSCNNSQESLPVWHIGKLLSFVLCQNQRACIYHSIIFSLNYSRGSFSTTTAAFSAFCSASHCCTLIFVSGLVLMWKCFRIPFYLHVHIIETFPSWTWCVNCASLAHGVWCRLQLFQSQYLLGILQLILFSRFCFIVIAKLAHNNTQF